LQDSFERVCALINKRDTELRRLARYLYEHDYLDSDEMDKVIKGQKLSDDKEQNKVRQWDSSKYGSHYNTF
jgi:hypothetical protein